MSAERSARSVSHAEGVDKVRALQRVLYRAAKQDPARRFHAVYDHVARSDILWRAWSDVRANRGAPGVDGLSIEAVEESGVAIFLGELAAALGAGTYRPAPLRRGAHPQGRPAGQDPAARHPEHGRPGGPDRSSDAVGGKAGADLPPRQLRLPSRAKCP